VAVHGIESRRLDEKQTTTWYYGKCQVGGWDSLKKKQTPKGEKSIKMEKMKGVRVTTPPEFYTGIGLVQGISRRRCTIHLTPLIIKTLCYEMGGKGQGSYEQAVFVPQYCGQNLV